MWVLDVYLLMAALDDAEVAQLLQQAKQAHVADDCRMFGDLAAVMGWRWGYNHYTPANRKTPGTTPQILQYPHPA
jgi:hypothetical protein